MAAHCEDCEQPGTERTIAGRHFVLCDRCNDRLLVQVALDDKILEIVDLSKRDPSEAIRILDQIQETHQWIDHDGWLNRNVRSQRALILTEHGHHDEALRELRAIEQSLTVGSEEFAENKSRIANVLERGGRPQEAIYELELALADRECLPTETLVRLLTALARVASKNGWAVSPLYYSSFERAVREWGMPVPPELLSSDLTQAILLAASRHLEAQDRYVALYETLRGNPPDMQARLLRDFIDAEPVGYFREMARRSLGADGAPEDATKQDR